MKNKVIAALSDDLRKPEYAGEHPLSGHCYVASESLFHLEPEVYKPMQVRVNGVSHWFLIERSTGNICDLTADQFGSTVVPYEKARGCGFLTKQPSKRAQVVIERVRGMQ